VYSSEDIAQRGPWPPRGISHLAPDGRLISGRPSGPASARCPRHKPRDRAEERERPALRARPAGDPDTWGCRGRFGDSLQREAADRAYPARPDPDDGVVARPVRRLVEARIRLEGWGVRQAVDRRYHGCDQPRTRSQRLTAALPLGGRPLLRAAAGWGLCKSYRGLVAAVRIATCPTSLLDRLRAEGGWKPVLLAVKVGPLGPPRHRRGLRRISRRATADERAVAFHAREHSGLELCFARFAEAASADARRSQIVRGASEICAALASARAVNGEAISSLPHVGNALARGECDSEGLDPGAPRAAWSRPGLDPGKSRGGGSSASRARPGAGISAAPMRTSSCVARPPLAGVGELVVPRALAGATGCGVRSWWAHRGSVDAPGPTDGRPFRPAILPRAIGGGRGCRRSRSSRARSGRCRARRASRRSPARTRDASSVAPGLR
jgi:hypothetical protein